MDWVRVVPCPPLHTGSMQRKWFFPGKALLRYHSPLQIICGPDVHRAAHRQVQWPPEDPVSRWRHPHTPPYGHQHARPTVTCQPVARSTPVHHTQPCRTQPGSGHLRNGTKAHCPHHTHSSSHHNHQTHTPLTHSIQANGMRNGGPHPKLGSLPRGGSSTSSSSSAGPRHSSRKLQSNPSITSQSSKRSKSSSKSNSSQIPTEAQDDCCVHCILACLFCEFLTLCNIVLDCATCGSCAGDDSCFCCCCASEECGDCDLPCDMDCGIIDACCESADCLEICMECCSLCFSS
ncbi:myoD family inhibitor domain-containing protein [Boleophthalmus pectinirostris]|uniref:myoD family inhibitor domain-containing protein n=1 Tax=Boleophthalmus pectinirostris TaxID=150288 RepID=UPI00242C410B|nr:myoD family inhibitor domain-containing protein [Boleophthalmus pectinirostris]